MKNTKKPAKINPTEEQTIEYPVRINKYLAFKKYTTRRGADVLIEKGQVTINGIPAKLGDKVKETDIVQVDSRAQIGTKNKVYLAYNKPMGIVTNLPQGDEQSIEDVTEFPWKVFTVGRLDKDSHGLIILTNDGRITDRLLNPKYIHEKEYVVEVNKELDSRFIKRLCAGVKLDDGYMTEPCEADMISPKRFRIILTEGKKRQIRRMTQALGYEVTDLARVRIGGILLSDIPKGGYRKIQGKQLEGFLTSLGLDPEV